MAGSPTARLTTALIHYGMHYHVLDIRRQSSDVRHGVLSIQAVISHVLDRLPDP